MNESCLKVSKPFDFDLFNLTEAKIIHAPINNERNMVMCMCTIYNN